ncbi:aspartate-tRNA ligase [Eggerthia catenaformis OT 569 = DSM 20559]|uniref:Aspartate--tRNA ligase n=1 Tax=Eggerthia catenaformis OT 569 = DSM 20559 TaxID=999415 RepID=M2NF67_9FIRM|nr:aspartate--tRNA ligase [Eggerthia catenaformis]EMD16853.1 aspartate-tRNA ligase [Eggerthia catenaformis OT 569 = DSM 20559]OUC51612.1 aspartate--tRNA ligase [Eggerthia catenaformis]
MERTHNNGELRLTDVGKKVTLIGWVAKKRNMGAIVFIDLRDRYGMTQIVFNDQFAESLKDVKNEYILQIKGEVAERSSKNPKMPTGDIEINAESFKVINTAKIPPIIIADETDASEETRLKYRYLDLRRPVLQNKIITRAKIVKAIHEFLDNEDFIEIETPYLNRSTPEGARDFLVPSRVHRGKFYALPQSPQLFKQLLMISGFEKYYQIARCFRDEDLRADRQPEFTQVDVEMSFMSTDQILSLGERLAAKIMKDVKNIDITLPLRRLTWHDAMETYGTDKPDTRFDLKLVNLNETVKDVDFAVFKNVLETNGYVKGINVRNKADYFSRKKIDALTEIAKKYKAKGLSWLKVNEEGIQGPIAKFFDDQQSETLLKVMDAHNGDLLLFAADSHYMIVCNALSAIRNYLGKELHLYDPSTFDFLWVIDFPMFEYDEEEGRYYAMHHPFTRPRESDLDKIDTDPAHCLADAYDIVLNGFELGGGSQRIYDEKLQERAFNALGFTKEAIRSQFGWFVDAFQYGAPPHGGFALGLDRIVMILTESDSLRDVIAFPKNTSASDPVTDAPGTVYVKQLDELGIEVKDNASQE